MRILGFLMFTFLCASCSRSRALLGTHSYQALIFHNRSTPTTSWQTWTLASPDQKLPLGGLGALLECALVDHLRRDGFVPKTDHEDLANSHRSAAEALGTETYLKYPWEKLWPAGLSASSLTWELDAQGKLFDSGRAYASALDIANLGMLVDETSCAKLDRLTFQIMGEGADAIKTWEDSHGNFIAVNAQEIFLGMRGGEAKSLHLTKDLLERIRSGDISK